jgi:hypothetical protein
MKFYIMPVLTSGAASLLEWFCGQSRQGNHHITFHSEDQRTDPPVGDPPMTFEQVKDAEAELESTWECATCDPNKGPQMWPGPALDVTRKDTDRFDVTLHSQVCAFYDAYKQGPGRNRM